MGAKKVEKHEAVAAERLKENAIAIGERIKAARSAAELSQQALADFLGKSRSAVAQWEGGHSLPSVEDFNNMAACMHIPAEYLAFNVDNRKSQHYLIPLVQYQGGASKLAQIGSIALDEGMMQKLKTSTSRDDLKSIVAPNAVEGHVAHGDRLVFDTSERSTENMDGTHLFVLWRESGPFVAEVTSSFDNPDTLYVKVDRHSQPVSRANMNVLGRVLTRTETL